MRWLRNRNALAVMLMVILAAAAAVAGLTMRGSRTVSDEQLPGTAVSVDAEPSSDAPLYLLVTAGSTTYEPILLEGETVFTLTQGDEMVNIIHATADSIWMESATCENQDCVEQGAVTRENRRTRVLGNMIICLPHQVQLELFTADELTAMGIEPAEE
ncbi:MAG: NusG domain II-containing protein [Christensenellaceae bacterium]|nr:NusG domain II-containing protein [Christensenellaceae bacterium]